MAKTIVGLGDLTGIFNVSEKTILSWAKLIGDDAKAGRGQYCLESFQEFAANRASCSKSLQQLQEEKIAAEIRKLNLESDAKEFDLAVKKGQYVALDEAISHINDCLLIARARFLAMPQKLALRFSAQHLTAKEVSQVLQDEIDQNLQSIADTLREYSDKKNPLETEQGR